MSSDLGWKSVELQIEALIPGIIAVLELRAIAFPWYAQLSQRAWIPSSEFAQAAAFIAISYSFGVILSLVSRSIVDTASENGPRALVFAAFAHGKLDSLVEECNKSDPRFPQDMEGERGKRHWTSVAKWNAVYRSALRRTTRGGEVDRRRSQGRFTRNLFFPAAGVASLISSRLLAVAVAIPTICLIMVLLYAYAEYVNFAEAYDIAEAKPR